MIELVNIQRDLKVPKERKDERGGFSYRNCEDILTALKPHLSKENCYITLSDDVKQVGERIYIITVATITNKDHVSISCTAQAREPTSKPNMDESQITGSASSYARKQALCGLFAIDGSEISNTDTTPLLIPTPKPLPKNGRSTSKPLTKAEKMALKKAELKDKPSKIALP